MSSILPEHQTKSLHAVCRECCKEFDGKRSEIRMTLNIIEHIKQNPGHVVFGHKEQKIIYKAGA